MTSHTIAIIGSGISGLSAAWLLSRSADVTLYEKALRPGGHSNTVIADVAEGSVAVDTGFIVFNERNYENLCALFAHLGVASAPSDMGFAVSVEDGRMEYSGRHLDGLFGQRRNLIRPAHWQLVSDILRFFREAKDQLANLPSEVSIGEFLATHGYSRVFIEDHILPMSAAIWSTPARQMLDFPARSFIEFFANHGLLQISDRPRWRTVLDGSRTYVDRLIEDGDFHTVTGAQIAAVLRNSRGAELVFADGQRRQFDEVVLACHADEALRLLGDATTDEREVLGAFRFSPNHAVLHTDRRFMPRRKRLWSAWNYLRSTGNGGERLSLTYWMNQLQPLETRTDLFVTLNPGHDFAPGSVHYEVTYEHPLFDAKAMAAQSQLWRIQGTARTWFAGAWMGYGFHEDGLQAGLEVAERIGGVGRPWTVRRQRDRIAHNWSGEERLLWAAE